MERGQENQRKLESVLGYTRGKFPPNSNCCFWQRDVSGSISLLSGACAKFVVVIDRNIRLIFRFTHVNSACMYVCWMYQRVFFSSTITLM